MVRGLRSVVWGMGPGGIGSRFGKGGRVKCDTWRAFVPGEVPGETLSGVGIGGFGSAALEFMRWNQ